MTITRLPALILTLVLCAGISRVHAAGLQGRVVDPDGRPVAGATVLVDGPLGTKQVDRGKRWPLRSRDRGRRHLPGDREGDRPHLRSGDRAPAR